MKSSQLHANGGSRAAAARYRLSPEEDVVGSFLDEGDDIDDSLPADLWFRRKRIGAGTDRQPDRIAVSIRTR